MWREFWRDRPEEENSIDVLNDVVNAVGIFLVSALWVVYLAFVFGPALP
ncbi:MAG: hypothetical protein K6U74_10410 [Firmicutes bacterium]|nr:hypothetical protein [Bacillota bacterium]